MIPKYLKKKYKSRNLEKYGIKNKKYNFGKIKKILTNKIKNKILESKKFNKKYTIPLMKKIVKNINIIKYKIIVKWKYKY